MKKLIISILIVFDLCFCSFAQDPGDYTKPFSELNKEKKAKIDAEVSEYGPGVLEGEGSDYREYLRWLNFWKPRIAPDGTYQSYNKSLKDYWDAQHSTRAYGNADPWTELGPYTKPNNGVPSIGLGGGQLGVGIIQSLIISRTNPSKLLGNSIAGGLFVTTDKGLNWSNAGSDGWFRSGCTAAAIAPDDENTWYAGSGMGGTYYFKGIGPQGGVWRTTDAGATWDLLMDRTTFNPGNPLVGESTIVRKILVDPKNPNIGYVCTNIGLYKSSNINATPASSVTWYPGTAPFLPIHSGDIEDIEFATDNTSTTTMFISYHNGSSWDIAESTDQGVTWISLPSQPSAFASTSQLVIEVSDAASNLLYVMHRDGGSSDLWTYDMNTPTWTAKASGFTLPIGQGHCFGVSNFNANYIYAGDWIYFDKSTDGGTTFSTVTSSLYHNDVEDIVTPYASCTACSTEVYVSTHGGVNYSPDQMATLQSRSNGLGIAYIVGGSGSQGNPAKIAMGLDHDGSVLSSGTYSSSWTPSWETVGNGDGGPSLIDYSNENNVWIESGNQSIPQISQTGGTPYTSFTATGFSAPANFNDSYRQNLVEPQIIYNASSTGSTSIHENLFRSSNLGLSSSTFEQISDFATYFPSTTPNPSLLGGMSPAPSDPNWMYLSVDDGIATSTLYRNTNMLSTASTVMASWVPLPFPGSHYNYGTIAVDLHDPNIVYLSYGGVSWLATEFYMANYKNPSSPIFTNIAGTASGGGLPNTSLGAIVLEKGSNGGIYVTSDVGVFYTNNSMIDFVNPPSTNTTQWINLGASLPHIPLTGLDINYTVNKIRAYTGGRGVWEHDLACPANTNYSFSGTQSSDAFYEAMNEVTSTASVTSSNTITYRAGTYELLSPGFVAAPDPYNFFNAFIHPCSTPGNSPGIRNHNQGNAFHLAGDEDDDEEKDNQNKLVVYPNPNEGQFTIELDANKNTNVFIYDTYGNIVARYMNVNVDKFNVDISAFSKGVYTVRTINAEDTKTAIIISK